MTRVELVVATDAHEGPVYVAAEDALYFTTQRRSNGAAPVVDIKRLALDGGRYPLDPARVTTVRADANVANGMTLAPDGGLLVCEQGTLTRAAAITRVDRRDGSVRTVVAEWRGLPLNSPNDVVVRGDGTIWFTDPGYGHLQGFRPPPQTGDVVYRYDPASRALDVVADGFDKPNGLAFSPDESLLYVGDSGAPHHIRAFDLAGGGDRVFAVIEPGVPDGLKVDAAGRVYTTADSGVQVFDPSGALVGEIALPGAVNFCFAGPDVLLITADDAIWAASIANERGA